MHIRLVLGGLVTLALAACETTGTPPTVTGTTTTSSPETSTASLEQRLSGTVLRLQSTDGDSAPMVMQLNEDGSSATSMGGFTLTGQWQVEGTTLCQTDIRLAGMPSDDQTPQCVEVSVSGDSVTLVGRSDDGNPETFRGTIEEL
ncbi:hypothetical protein [Histidinibacterium aquaticum]|uniref:Lipocalin-like domain-containing protein n=1 Tax=Histidinibacterium aquaticum TaxID=2613962 RepID=A0A5J5GHS8_9RHOB|nr:hypothetical protein [Histidinibacterium aquaticum]KAA9007789.1 hypothetical protein F3S47_09680 [Histidinibacterium aquaticum]